MNAIASISTARTTDQPISFGRRVNVPAALPPAMASAITVDDVCDLLAAAGPLTLHDIAGGLAVPAGRAAARVRQLVRGRELQRDEFGRYRLCGERAMA